MTEVGLLSRRRVIEKDLGQRSKQTLKVKRGKKKTNLFFTLLSPGDFLGESQGSLEDAGFKIYV